jgi:hypothetical protein
MRVDVDVGLQGWSLGARAQIKNIPAGKGIYEQKPGTTQIEHQSMHENEGYRGLRYRLQQRVEVNGPFIPGGTMCCVVETWIQRFTSVAQIGEVQQPRPGFARTVQ